MKSTVWGKVPNTHYIVSIDGEVRSLSRKTECIKNDVKTFIRFKGKLLSKICEHQTGYYNVKLSTNGKVVRHRIHRLVAEVFLGYKEGLQVNHIDLVKTNNNIENLEWLTHRQNALHAHGYTYK